MRCVLLFFLSFTDYVPKLFHFAPKMLQQVTGTLVAGRQFWRYDNLETVAQIGFQRTLAQASFGVTQLGYRHIVGEAEFHLVPVETGKQREGVVQTVVDTSPELVLVFQQARHVESEGLEREICHT